MAYRNILLFKHESLSDFLMSPFKWKMLGCIQGCIHFFWLYTYLKLFL